MLARVVIAAMLAAVLISALGPVAPAAACSLAGFSSPEERLQRQVDGSDAILVGEVVVEEVTGDWGGVPPRPRYTSTVRAAAVLKGDVTGDVVIPDLGTLTASCGGGPRMAEGERVLVFLHKGDPDSVGRIGLPSHPDAWRIALVGQGKYRLVDGEAFFERDYEGEHPPQPAGSARRLIEEAGRLVAADADEILRAIEFAAGRLDVVPVSIRPPASDAAPPAGASATQAPSAAKPPSEVVAAVVFAMVLLAAVIVVGLRRRRRSG